MKWITRSHVHVDRVACPWLITRFIDNEAEFLFVPKNQVDEVAKEMGAIPFDAPGVELGHHEGRCSFESILLKYDLKDAGLLRLAKIVHAADVAEDIDTDPAESEERPASTVGHRHGVLEHHESNVSVDRQAPLGRHPVKGDGEAPTKVQLLDRGRLA